MSKFKVGDKVRCVEPGYSANNLTWGKVYTVEEARCEDILIVTDNGYGSWRFGYRFELAKATEVTSSELFVVEGTGDKARFNTWDEVQKYVGDVGEPCVVYRLYAKATPERKVNMEFV